MNPYSVIQIILYLFAAVLASIAIFDKSKPDKKNNLYNKLYLVCIILTLGFSILLEALKADDERTKSDLKEKEYKEYIGRLNEIIKKSDKIIDSTNKIVELQDKLQEANSQIMLLSKELKNQLVGDKTAPEMYALILDDEHKIKFHLSNPSKFPIPDIYVQLSDWSKVLSYDSNGKTFVSPLDDAEININLGTLSPNEKIRPVCKINLLNAMESNYMLFVQWRGGSYVYWVKVKKERGKFKVAGYDYLLSNSKHLNNPNQTKNR